MSTTEVSTGSANGQAAATGVAMRIEMIVMPVSDSERTKQFYERLGWRLDADFPGPDGYRVIQFTPPGSAASVAFGTGVTSSQPGSIESVLLVVDDIEAARAELIGKGVEVSEVFHDARGGLGGGFIADTSARAPGLDPERRSYASYARFSDPDGNGWLLQELTERLPGRV